jgi:hypothetical protein
MCLSGIGWIPPDHPVAELVRDYYAPPPGNLAGVCPPYNGRGRYRFLLPARVQRALR